MNTPELGTASLEPDDDLAEPLASDETYQVRGPENQGWADAVSTRR
jgi:hypothetical protein